MSIRYLVSILAVAIGSMAGCASLGNSLKKDVPAAALGTYSVQFTSPMLGRQLKTYPLREGMTVQDVLHDSGQLSRHRNFEIDLLRKSATDDTTIKMPVQFDASKHRIKYETDYAIYPGDRVLIRPVAYSPMDQMAQMLGPSEK